MLRSTSRFKPKLRPNLFKIKWRIEWANSQLIKAATSGSKIAKTNYCLKTYVAHLSEPKVWQGNNDKIFEGRENSECYESNKIQETNIVFSNWNAKFFPLCFLFLRQQCSRGRISTGRQISIELKLWHHDEIRYEAIYKFPKIMEFKVI